MFVDVGLPVGEMVEAPPPTVDMTTRPTPLVMVMTSPAVREMLGEVVVAAACAEVVAGEVELGTEAGLDEVLVDVVVIGELPAELEPVSVTGPTGVEGSDMGATGVGRVVVDWGLTAAGVVVGTVPLLISPARLARSTTSIF